MENQPNPDEQAAAEAFNAQAAIEAAQDQNIDGNPNLLEHGVAYDEAVRLQNDAKINRVTMQEQQANQQKRDEERRAALPASNAALSGSWHEALGGRTVAKAHSELVGAANYPGPNSGNQSR